jgi:Na+/melibiose symporter-like transporter
VPIVTHQKKIPWLWAFFIGFPWVAFVLNERVSVEPFTFTLRKFIDDPGLISFLASINILFNFMVGMAAAYLSDHVWTKWGRRKPFLVTSFASVGVILFFIPLVGNIWTMVVAIVAYQFFVDVGKPWEALFNEVIPPPQRGRAGIFRMMLVNLGVLFFSTVLIGQFDHQYGFSTPLGALNGEMVLYWTCALAMGVTALFLGFFVKETLPHEDPGDPETVIHPTRFRAIRWIGPREKGLKVITSLFKSIFGHRQNLWIFGLYLCPVMTSSFMGPNQVLMMTDQLGLSKPDLARLNAIGMPFMVFAFTPFAGYLADRLSRIWMMRIGIMVPALVQVGFWIYLKFGVDYNPHFGVLIAVGIATSFFQSWLWAVWGPLIFDYVPSKRMGTCLAGITFTAGIAGFFLINLGGLWVKGWTRLFGSIGLGRFDYSSILLLWLVMASIALVGTFVFQFAVFRGWVLPEGKMEVAEMENGDG